MKRNGLFRVLLTLFFVVSAAVIFFFYRMYQRDIRLLDNFVVSYKKSEKAISDFSVLFLSSNSENYNFGLVQNIKNYNKVIDLIKDMAPNGDRQMLIKDVAARNVNLLKQLDKINESELKADCTIKELKSKSVALSGISSLIKNDVEIKNAAIETVDLSQKELDHLSLYKRIIERKLTETNDLLKKITEDKVSTNLPVKIQVENLDSITNAFKLPNQKSKTAYQIIE